MASLVTVEDYEARQTEIRARISEIDAEFAGQALPDEARSEWNEINEELEANQKVIEELKERKLRVEELAGRAQNREEERVFTSRRNPHISNIPDDPTDMSEYRKRVGSLDELQQLYKDGARKVVETRFSSAHPSVSREEAQNDVDKLIDRDNEVAQRVIFTSSNNYRKEFATYMKSGGAIVGREMAERTMSLTTTAGGYAVPVDLDTTLILANAGVVNPIRNLARVRQTNGNTVEWINTAGITAGFNAEATEASDNAPVLAQPTANVEKAFAFVPMSIEIFEDWDGVQADLAVAFADAKNQLESQKFLTGLGHGTHEPQGLIAVGGATAVSSTATTAVLAIADLYTLELALAARYRNDASCAIVGNKAAFQKVRQFATASGPSAWTDSLRDGNPNQLLGYPAYEWSNYASTITTSGSTVLTIGAFNYFGIVDRVGLNVEFIPHLFGSSNRYPTGQRGLYMYWRTSSALLSPSLSATSAFQSLKIL